MAKRKKPAAVIGYWAMRKELDKLIQRAEDLRNALYYFDGLLEEREQGRKQ